MTMLEGSLIVANTITAAVAAAALAVALTTRQASSNKARRVARREASQQFHWHRNAVELRLCRVETDSATHRAALKVHGILKGDRIVPDRPMPAIYTPKNGEGASA